MAKPWALLLRKCDEYQGRAALISLTIMLFLATIVVAVRLYIRLFIVHGCGYDDYFILGSLVSYPAAQCPSLTKIRSPAVLRSACTSNNLQRGWESLHTACRSNKSSILRNGPFFPSSSFPPLSASQRYQFVFLCHESSRRLGRGSPIISGFWYSSFLWHIFCKLLYSSSSAGPSQLFGIRMWKVTASP